MIASRSPAAKVSAPPPAVAKVPADAPIPKVIVPMGEPFLWTFGPGQAARPRRDPQSDRRAPDRRRRAELSGALT
jgi:hypothetical protein